MNNKQRFFQKAILAWYARNRRPLPWRKTRNPYRILVSEIMLQQTQVDRVIPKYQAFLKRFPTPQRLATASRHAVLRVWQGLGYNSRAIRLQEACRAVAEKLGERFPRTLEGLEALPGVGRYTARALAAFAFGQDVAAVDTNHQRVVSRFFFGTKAVKKTAFDRFAEGIVPNGRGYDWNHALMDFGALICKSRPLCNTCPLRSSCSAYPAVLRLPTRRRRAQSEQFHESNRYVRGHIIRMLSSLPRGGRLRLSALKNTSVAQCISLPRLRTAVLGLTREGLVHTAKHGDDWVVALAEK